LKNKKMSNTLKFICFMAVIAATHLQAQSYEVGHTTLNLIDAARSNRSIPVEVYYPATAAGDNVAVAGNRKFPVVSFGHGFVMTWDAYKNVWNALVPQGFIIALPKTEGTTSPSHSEFGKDLAFVLSAMDLQGKNSSSLFYNKVDTLNCVMGHSMGGGAAFIATSQSAKITCIATLAAAETNPSAIKAASALNIPALVIAGGNDCVTPPSAHQIPMYDSLKGCKTYVSITGGSHCQMSEDNFLCNFGEATCTPRPAISRAVQHQVLFRFLVPWLRFHLLRDCRAGQTFDSLIVKDAAIAARKNCVLCPVNSLSQLPSSQVVVYPVPVNEVLNLSMADGVEITGCELFTAQGRFLFHWNLYAAGNVTLNMPERLPTGIYLLRITSGEKQQTIRFVKQ
jgi:pimeloyl-ACP methyl ester carboxylesterase